MQRGGQMLRALPLLLLLAAGALAPHPCTAQLSGSQAAAQLAAVKAGDVQMNGMNLGGWLVLEDWCAAAPHRETSNLLHQRELRTAATAWACIRLRLAERLAGIRQHPILLCQTICWPSAVDKQFRKSVHLQASTPAAAKQMYWSLGCVCLLQFQAFKAQSD